MDDYDGTTGTPTPLGNALTTMVPLIHQLHLTALVYLWYTNTTLKCVTSTLLLVHQEHQEMDDHAESELQGSGRQPGVQMVGVVQDGGWGGFVERLGVAEGSGCGKVRGG